MKANARARDSTTRCSGASSQKQAFELKALLSFSQSNFETGCAFKLGSSLHRPSTAAMATVACLVATSAHQARTSVGSHAQLDISVRRKARQPWQNRRGSGRGQGKAVQTDISLTPRVESAQFQHALKVRFLESTPLSSHWFQTDSTCHCTPLHRGAVVPKRARAMPVESELAVGRCKL